MFIKEITIGRDKNCDIVLDEQCSAASRMHALLLVDNNSLIYKDISRNGTLINNININNRSIPIHHGDNIMIAGRYPLSWNTIDRYIPNTSQNTERTIYGQTIQEVPNNIGYNHQKQNSNTSLPNLNKWSWGAFALYPLWGFFNGCWWAILINLFLGWTLIPSIIFGIKGRDLS